MTVLRRFSGDVLDRAHSLYSITQPLSGGYEATHLLVFATSLIVIPFEHLTSRSSIRNQFSRRAYREWQLWSGKPFADFPGIKIKEWHYASGDLSNDSKKPFFEGAFRDRWMGTWLLRSNESLEGESLEFVVRCMRNALAHGNVIYLNDEGQETEGKTASFFLFVSPYDVHLQSSSKECMHSTKAIRRRNIEERRTHYNLLAVRLGTFADFLECWASLLKSPSRTSQQRSAEG